MLVSDILKDKGAKVTMVAGAQTVREALKTMVDNKIGAVLVFRTPAHIQLSLRNFSQDFIPA